jgi:hypothetical protein
MGRVESSRAVGSEADGGNAHHGRFIKNLFAFSGEQVGFIPTRFTLTLSCKGRIEARTDSNFGLGRDPEAPPFLTGGVSRVAGLRLRAN